MFELFNLFSKILNNINSLSCSGLIKYILINKNIFLFFIFIYLGILLDNRFKLKNKIFIFLAFICFVFLMVILKGVDSFLIKDIFWYTLTLNVAFIFHVCICDWLYNFFNYYKMPYVSFLITRISFILSLSFIVYLLNVIYIITYNNIKKFKKTRIFSYWESLLIYRFAIVVSFIIHFFNLILLYFIKLFSFYSLTLMGKHNLKLTSFILFKYLMFFIATYFVAYLVLGISRLYFLWIIIFISSCANLIIKNGAYFFKEPTTILKNYTANNIDILKSKYNLAYSENFCYSFLEFLDYKEVILSKNNVEFHVSSPFKYYSRYLLILTFIRSHFKRYISYHGGLNNRSIVEILEKAEIFNLTTDEKNFLKKLLKKLYKRSLN
jgi:hypothetical protein